MTRKRWMGFILLIVIGGAGWISYRALHQAALDHDLIAVAAKGDPFPNQTIP